MKRHARPLLNDLNPLHIIYPGDIWIFLNYASSHTAYLMKRNIYWREQFNCQNPLDNVEPLLHSPSQRGTALSHTTLPSLRMQEMVCEPWVFTKPSSHRNEMELPSWRLSPKRFPLTGTPGSGHSLWRNAVENTEKRWGQSEREDVSVCDDNVYVFKGKKKSHW